MSGAPGQQEVRRGRLQGWLQTAAFLGAAAILAMVVYTSAAVQSNRRAQEAAATAAVQTQTVAAVLRQRSAAVPEIPPTENWELYASTPLPAARQPIHADSAARVVEVARWGRGVLSSVAWSPAGGLLAVGTTIGVYLYEPRTLQEYGFLDTSAGVGSMVFSPDGQSLALTLSGGRVQLWSVVDDALVHTVEEVHSSHVAVGFAPDGGLLAAWMRPGETLLVVWHDGTEVHLPLFGVGGGPLAPLDTSREVMAQPVGPVAVALSPDGRLAAAGMTDGFIYLWQISDWEAGSAGGPVTMIPAGLLGGEQLVFSPNGRLLAVASSDREVQLWQIPGGTLLYALGAGTTGVSTSLAFSPDGRSLVWVAGQSARFYGVDSGALVRVVDLPSGSPDLNVVGMTGVQAAFSPDGQVVAIVAASQQLALFGVEDGAVLQAVSGFALPWASLSLSPDGRTAAVRSFADGSIWLWDVARAVPQHTLQAQEASWSGGAFSPDGRILATGEGPQVVLWEVADGTAAGRLSPDAPPVGPTVLPEGTPAAVVTTVVTTRRLYTATGEYPPDPGAGRGGDRMLCTAFAPDGRAVAGATSTGQVYLWQVPGGGLRWTAATTPSADAVLCSLAFSPGGQRLVASWLGSDVYLWRVLDGTLVQRWAVPQEWTLVGTAISPDGQIVAAWTSAGEVSLWPVAGGEALRVLTATEAGLALAYSPDGSLLAGASMEGLIYLWRVDDGTLLHVLEGHTSLVVGLAFSPDERLLFSASVDGTVRVWGVR